MAQDLEEKDLDPGSARSARPQHTVRCNFIESCARLSL